MAGYSGTPLPRKLGIKTAHRVAIINGPRGFARGLQPLPADVTLREDLRAGNLDVIVLFVPVLSALHARFAPAARKLTSAGGLWIAWPKKSSGVATDVTESDVRSHGLDSGLVDNKICAIDDVWSGLRFVYRLKDR